MTPRKHGRKSRIGKLWGSKARLIRVALAVALALVATGCFWDMISWSPDGRYIAFFDPGGDDKSPDAGVLWRWDVAQERAEKLDLRDDATPDLDDRTVHGMVQGCHYMPDGKHLAVLVAPGTKDDKLDLWLRAVNGDSSVKIASGVEQTFDVGPDGTIYYVRKTKDAKGKEIIQLLSCSYGKSEKREKLLLTQRGDIAFPKISPSGKRLLFSAEKSLGVLDMDSGTTRALISDTSRAFYWPAWLSDKTVLYIFAEDDKDNIGSVQELDLATGKTRMLADNLVHGPRYAISPDRRSIVVATNPDFNASSTVKPTQLVRVNLETGKTKTLLECPLTPMHPSFSPDGRRLAYWIYDDKNWNYMEILDLATGKTSIAARDDEEKALALAHDLDAAGHPAKAIDALNDMLARFPATRLKNIVLFDRIRLHRDQPEPDVDAAFADWRAIDNDDLQAQAWPFLWRDRDRLATDPADDWITTYTTPKAIKEYSFNTDQARDLRALWARAGKEKLYFRVDYARGIDLDGVAFQDTLIAMHQTGQGGDKALSPGAVWDRPVTYSILMREWHSGGDKSRYDMELRAPNRNPVLIRVQGIPDFAPSQAYCAAIDPAHALLIAVDCGLLGLKDSDHNWLGMKNGDCALELQACTFKGGADDVKGLERPRVTKDAKGNPVCDVADAFGPENTAARARADHAAHPDKPFVVRGVAGTLRLTPGGEQKP
jgi:Tol biopolymer transport system component